MLLYIFVGTWMYAYLTVLVFRVRDNQRCLQNFMRCIKSTPAVWKQYESEGEFF